MRPAMTDQMKAHGLRLLRRAHRRTLESTSERTYRRRAMPTSPTPRLVPAARAYRRMGWLPTELIAPETMPREARLPLRYYLPYYGTSKLAWTLYGRAPIDPDLAWQPELDWNGFFPEPPPGWGSPSDDEHFTALRLQGPNPFMLRLVDADPGLGENAGDAIWKLDFSELFEGVFAPTVARFRLGDDGLTPTTITIGAAVHRPGEPGWADAKRVVNALDSRYAVFIRHLLNVHLMVGQAYALAAYALPIWHPLRPFMHFFTYGTLVVNDAAYKALLTPDSYFLRSHFVSAQDARRFVDNAMSRFDFDEWIWPRDRAARGLADIPNHPYVADADLVWPAMADMVAAHLDRLEYDDARVRGDREIARWFETLATVLPGHERLERLETRAELEELMTALLWNNVVHEVCGNLAPILDSRDPRDLVGINFDHLRSLVDPDRDTLEPRAADVLLMDQAAYVSRFNVAGNNLLDLPVARFVDDPRLRDDVIALQHRLREIDAELAERNRQREIPFQTMQPAKLEASISF